MSTQLINARKKLNSVNSYLKMGKHMPAVQCVRDGLVLMLKASLMKAERGEFEELLKNATYSLNADSNLRKVYPLVINYEPGKERALLNALNELLQALQDAVADEAKQDIEALTKKREDGLRAGQEHLDREEYDRAQAVFNDLVKEFNDDTDLKADVADRYLKAERYQEALSLLETALRDDPNAIYLYNRIGIVLRKLGDFETAEKYYLRALAIRSDDEYLFFNTGRLYYDWKKWKKMGQAAKRALDINPNFKEAAQMLKFAQKKLS